MSDNGLDMRAFWQEWIRVLSRELFLITLLVYFHITHASDTLQAALIAGILTLMNSTRFQYPAKPPQGEHKR